MADALTMKQVAERLGISERTVIRFIRSGELKAFKLGRSVRIMPEDLDEYLREHPARKDDEEAVE